MENGSELEQFWQEFLLAHPHLKEQRYYEAFAFGNTERTANTLAAVVLSGVKTATSSLLWETEQQQKPLLQAGDYSIVTTWDQQPVCVIETTEVRILPFKDVDAAFAFDYGEGDRTLDWWKREMWDYYVDECLRLGRQASEEMSLICERFRVVYKR